MLKEIHQATDQYLVVTVLAAIVFYFAAIMFMAHQGVIKSSGLPPKGFVDRHVKKFHISSWGVFACLMVLALFTFVVRQWYPIIEEDFYRKCETGEFHGVQCSENVLSGDAAVVSPGNRDPLHIRE